MSILHFSGKFKYQPPKYNNEPGNPERYFDSSISPEDVQKNITEGVEPLQYFEFEFLDVRSLIATGLLLLMKKMMLSFVKKYF